MRELVGDALELRGAADMPRARGKAVMGAALVFAAASVVMMPGFLKMTLLLIAILLGFAAIGLQFGAQLQRQWDMLGLRRVLQVLHGDPANVLVTRRNGDLLWVNPAARRDLGAMAGGRLKDVLSGLLADPDAAMQSLPKAGQITVERAVGPASLTKLPAPRGCAIWRIEDRAADQAGDGFDDEKVLVDADKNPLRSNRAEEALDGWSFFDALPVPLLKLSSDGAIELSNRLARDLLGIDSGAGRKLSELMEGPGRSVGDWLRDAAEGRGTVQPETLQLRRPDRDMFVQVSLNPAQDAGRTVLIAVMQDATKLKSLEQQFVQSQKMQAIGQLAGGVAHDFNNLLTAISGHCDLLLLRRDMEDPDYPDLMQINQNANRAAALVAQLLAFSRKQTLRPQLMDMREMLADLTHLLNRLVGEKVHLALNHAADLWAVRADKRQLEQVLMNLVVNARDAMPDGGEIAIRTENLNLKSPLKRGRAVMAPGRYVVLTVKDHGEGIAPEVVEKVFEPFYTTKKQGEGTGLGLSTAYGIIKQTGGFIFVESEVGQGTEFTIYLPAHDRIEEDLAIVEDASPVGRPKGIVMLVEDEAPVRAFASRALKMRGLSVVEASSGEEALGALEDGLLAVDVIVTDVVMPGLDGPSWVKEALKTRPDVRVVFVSGYASDALGNVEDDIADAVFLPKPFSLTELTETVQKQMLDRIH